MIPSAPCGNSSALQNAMPYGQFSQTLSSTPLALWSALDARHRKCSPLAADTRTLVTARCSLREDISHGCPSGGHSEIWWIITWRVVTLPCSVSRILDTSSGWMQSVRACCAMLVHFSSAREQCIRRRGQGDPPQDQPAGGGFQASDAFARSLE